jgi:hypothetical protein
MENVRVKSTVPHVQVPYYTLFQYLLETISISYSVPYFNESTLLQYCCQPKSTVSEEAGTEHSTTATFARTGSQVL